MENNKEVLVNYKIASVLVSSHAVFNYLTAIQNQVTFDQKRDALNSLSSYAKFLRKVLQLPALGFWSVEEEINLLQNYLDMEKMRFGDQISYEVLENQIPKSEKIPVLTCAPFIELLVASTMKANPKQVKIQLAFRKTSNEIFLEAKVNKASQPFEQLERNNEQKERYQLFQEKIELLQLTFSEKLNLESTNYKLSLNHPN